MCTYRFAVGIMHRRDDSSNHDEAARFVKVFSGFLYTHTHTHIHIHIHTYTKPHIHTHNPTHNHPKQTAEC